MQADLEHAVHMHDDCLSMVSHELRNPLNTLFLQARLRKHMADADRLPDLPALRRMA